jgi:hypothetical protein
LASRNEQQLQVTSTTEEEPSRDEITPGATARPRSAGDFLIIGGAEKAGTTSLYGYLASHAEICASSSKETDYFRRADVSMSGYLEQFPPLATGHRIRLESSPGYLAESASVAPAMANVVPRARLVFVLRDPVDRLRSCFHFYQSRLHLPPSMSIGEYANLTMLYAQDQDAARSSGLLDWHLDALSRGRYDLSVPHFWQHFSRSQILLIAYESLARDARSTTRRVAVFGGVDPDVYERFAFNRENVSFTARHRGVQRLAIALNDRCQLVWRRFPRVKRSLLSAYKAVNASQGPGERLSPALREQLADFYQPTYAFMKQNLTFNDGISDATS